MLDVAKEAGSKGVVSLFAKWKRDKSVRVGQGVHVGKSTRVGGGSRGSHRCTASLGTSTCPRAWPSRHA